MGRDFKFPLYFGQIQTIFWKCSMTTKLALVSKKCSSNTLVSLVLSTHRPLLICSKCSHLFPVNDGNAGIYFFFLN